MPQWLCGIPAASTPIEELLARRFWIQERWTPRQTWERKFSKQRLPQSPGQRLPIPVRRAKSREGPNCRRSFRQTVLVIEHFCVVDVRALIQGGYAGADSTNGSECRLALAAATNGFESLAKCLQNCRRQRLASFTGELAGKLVGFGILDVEAHLPPLQNPFYHCSLSLVTFAQENGGKTGRDVMGTWLRLARSGGTRGRGSRRCS